MTTELTATSSIFSDPLALAVAAIAMLIYVVIVAPRRKVFGEPWVSYVVDREPPEDGNGEGRTS
jgi:low affinity Fe/Cu permease